jgi:hypothetical protein
VAPPRAQPGFGDQGEGLGRTTEREEKTMNVRVVLLAAAVICFVVSAFGVPSRVNLQSLGLALGFASFLF